MRSLDDRYNFIQKLNALVAAGIIPMLEDKGRPPLAHIHIEHDQDCLILRGKKRCDCDPVITLNGHVLKLPADA